jgi:hypothetical protein
MTDKRLNTLSESGVAAASRYWTNGASRSRTSSEIGCFCIVAARLDHRVVGAERLTPQLDERDVEVGEVVRVEDVPRASHSW